MIAHEWDVPVNSNNILKMRLRRLPVFVIRGIITLLLF